MGWFLRHYSTFADKIFIFLEPSPDGTEKIVKSFPKAELRKWPSRGLDDNRFTEAASSWYKESRGKADFVGWVDCDELLFHENILSVLEKADGDIFPSTGYALISQTGWPDPKLEGQLWEHVKTGVRQSNYDKKILFRPSLDIQFSIGRHTYNDPGRQWPKHNGKECSDVGIKLLHAHYTGGIEDSAQRNRRNYARAVNKQHAWNFAPGHNENPKQSGSVAWVADAIQNNKLIDVFTGQPILGKTVLKKIQFGSGSSPFPDWDNRDIETDIRKTLPFPDNSVSHVYCSHTVEHVTQQEAWNFFSECYRVLVKGGRIRIAIPDFTKLERDMTEEYQNAVKAGGHGDGSKLAALKACVFAHGHRSVWNSALLRSFLKTIGFTVSAPAYGESTDPVLCNCERHGAIVGESVARTETSCVEGVKA